MGQSQPVTLNFSGFRGPAKPETAMQATRSPSVEMPHAIGALVDTAFVRSAVADAAGPVAARPAPSPSAWQRVIARLRAALARHAARG